MAFNVGSVSIRLLANVRQFRRDMASAGNSLRGFQRGAVRAGRIAGTAIGAGLGAIATQTVLANRELLLFSKRLGVDIEQLQGLAFAFEQTGVRQTDFLTTVQKIQRRADAAAAGNTALADAFTLLGIDAKKFADLGVESQIRVLFEALRQAEGDTGALQSAFQLLDVEGQALRQTASEGAKALEDYIKQAKELGLVNRDAAEQSDELAKAISRIGGAIRGRVNSVLSFSRFLREGLAEAGSRVKDFIAERIPQLGLETRAQQAQKESAEAAAAASKASAELANVEASAQARKALLERLLEAKRRALGLLSGNRGVGQGRQINRALDFVNTSGANRQNRVVAPQLERTNSLLADIRNSIRNNSTGANVVFTN